MSEPLSSSAAVLIADDDRIGQMTLEMFLTQRGYKVIAAHDGVEALERIKEARPDICILDFDMPRMNGLEVCRIIKSDPDTRLLPVIMLTGLSPEREKINALEAGCDDFLTKPVQESELLARMQSLLRVKSLTDALENAEAVLFTLARIIEAKDLFTRGHADRVGRYAAAFGKALGLSPENVELLRKGGILHDVGKMGIPDSILLKRGPLDDDEWALMRRHPAIGCEICRRLKGLGDILPLIRHHHERLDGSGYPDGLKSGEIPELVRIINVVDIYDALTSRRSYKDAYTPEKTFKVMREEAERGWWDGKLVGLWEDMVLKNAAGV